MVTVRRKQAALIDSRIQDATIRGAETRDSSAPSSGEAAGLTGLARDVYEGLTSKQKYLPSYLFYDAVGSALYEKITELPEYYPNRTEDQILTRYATEIVKLATGGRHDLAVAELGAGTSSKSAVILRALVEHQGQCVYVPTDVSTSALKVGAARIRELLPQVETRSCVGLHEQAFQAIERLGGHRLVMFIGSSIGNLSDSAAVALMGGLRRHLDPGCYLLLGTDMKKSKDVLLPAYNDAQGITAQFNKNSLCHVNRVLGAEFDLARFRHVALWNEAESRIEMHLESMGAQVVAIAELGLHISFSDGETIHTESSVKYDGKRVDEILRGSGFERVRTFTDSRHWFGVHLARAA